MSLKQVKYLDFHDDLAMDILRESTFIKFIYSLYIRYLQRKL